MTTTPDDPDVPLRAGDRVQWADRTWLVGGETDGRAVLYGDGAVTAYVPPKQIERRPTIPTPTDLLAADKRFLVEDPDGAPYPDHAQDVIWQLVDALRAADKSPPDDQPEWVRCVDASGCDDLTTGKVYRVTGNVDEPLYGRDGGVRVFNDNGREGVYMASRFIPGSADEATVTIDVPVAWAQWAAAKPWPSVETFVRDACREGLTKAGLL